jgi:hypothetical protein
MRQLLLLAIHHSLCSLRRGFVVSTTDCAQRYAHTQPLHLLLLLVMLAGDAAGPRRR